MKRMYLKKQKKHKNILNIIVFLLILLIIGLIILLRLFNKVIIPQLVSYSEIETKKIVSSIISSTVMEETYKNTNLNQLFLTEKDNNGNINNIDFNPNYVNQILVNTYNAVLKNLMYLESGEIEKLNLQNLNLTKYNNEKLENGIIYEVPTGMLFNNVMLNNIFPKIPVKMDLVGNIFCRLSTDVKSYGINNAIISVNVVVEVEVKILLPFVSQNAKIVESIPILIKMIEGNVPSYYFDGYLSTPSITKSID